MRLPVSVAIGLEFQISPSVCIGDPDVVCVIVCILGKGPNITFSVEFEGFTKPVTKYWLGRPSSISLPRYVPDVAP